MPWESWEIEGEARSVFERAGLSPECPTFTERLARRTPGLTGVRFVRGLAHSTQLVANDDGTHVIEARAGLSPVALNWGIAHELGEHVLATQPFPYREPDVERVANHLAGALVVPKPALRNLYAVYGHHIERLAQAFVTSQTILALRLGEALDLPVALVSAHHVLRRGPPEELPGDAQLVECVRRGLPLRSGWRTVRLTDARHAWAVLPAW